MSIDDKWDIPQEFSVTVGEMIEHLKKFDSNEEMIALWKMPMTKKEHKNWARGWDYSNEDWRSYASYVNEHLDLHYYNKLRVNASRYVNAKNKKAKGESINIKEWWAGG